MTTLQKWLAFGAVFTLLTVAGVVAEHLFPFIDSGVLVGWLGCLTYAAVFRGGFRA